MRKFFILTVLFFTVACSSNNERPSELELKTYLQSIDSTIPASVSTCQAKKLYESEVLSDDSLISFVENKEYSMSVEENKALAPGGSVWLELKNCEKNK